MRLFIAIEIPAAVKKEIVESTSTLRKKFPQINWVKHENLHLTLKFLGTVRDEHIIKKIKLGIEKGIQDVSPFMLEFKELGFFDRGELIIWLGINKNQSLNSLVKSLETELAKLGFKKEKREFNPHVTIGRGKRLTIDLKDMIRDNILNSKFTHIKNYILSEVSLMQSKLNSRGANYKTIDKFPFLAKGV